MAVLATMETTPFITFYLVMLQLKKRQHRALLRLHFPLINLWKPLQVIPVDHAKAHLMGHENTEHFWWFKQQHFCNTRRQCLHLQVPAQFPSKTKDAGGPSTSSIRLGVIRHRLLQIAQEGQNQCRTKLTWGQNWQRWNNWYKIGYEL